MASKTWVPGTVIDSPWLNDVNDTVYDVLGDGVSSPATKAAARTNLGLGTMAQQNAGAVNITGGSIDGVSIDVNDLSAPVPIAKGGTGIATIIPTGQCRVVKSGANVVLQRFNGDKLAFPAGYASIPAAGVSLAPTGLTPATEYNIYAVQTAGVVTSLEASATAYIQDTTTGIPIKTGDATRVLVGRVRPITGPAFQDTAAQRFVISWYNRRQLQLNVPLVNATGVFSTYPAFGQLGVNSMRAEFIKWADDSAHGLSQGYYTTNVSGLVYHNMMVDGVLVEGGTVSQATLTTVYQYYISHQLPGTVSEGYHYFAHGCAQSAVSTTTFGSSVNVADVRCSIQGWVLG